MELIDGYPCDTLMDTRELTTGVTTCRQPNLGNTLKALDMAHHERPRRSTAAASRRAYAGAALMLVLTNPAVAYSPPSSSASSSRRAWLGGATAGSTFGLAWHTHGGPAFADEPPPVVEKVAVFSGGGE